AISQEPPSGTCAAASVPCNALLAQMKPLLSGTVDLPLLKPKGLQRGRPFFVTDPVSSSSRPPLPHTLVFVAGWMLHGRLRGFSLVAIPHLNPCPLTGLPPILDV